MKPLKTIHFKAHARIKDIVGRELINNDNGCTGARLLISLTLMPDSFHLKTNVPP